jgi:hypothetical protein
MLFSSSFSSFKWFIDLKCVYYYLAEGDMLSNFTAE